MEDTTPASSAPPLVNPGEDKTVAIVAYITLIGFIAAIVIHSNKKTKLGAFHLRQMLGYFISGLIFWVCAIVLLFIPFLGWLCIVAGWLFLIVCWVLGLIAAINGQMKPMPLIGPMFQKWFGTTFD
jgi:uncharacterized membrane protein